MNWRATCLKLSGKSFDTLINPEISDLRIQLRYKKYESTSVFYTKILIVNYSSHNIHVKVKMQTF